MKKQIPAVAVVAIAVLIVAVAGYMSLIRPKQAETRQVRDQIAVLETDVQLERQRQELLAAELGATDEVTVRVADLVRLAKTMPEDQDVAGILVELDAIALGAGVEFLSISPQEPLDGGGFVRQPIQLTFSGSYFDLSELLYQLRNLVRVREGRLQATGRLFTLDQFDIHEAEGGFPAIEALVTLSAYRYGNLLVDDLLTIPPELQSGTEGTPTETFESGGGTADPPALPESGGSGAS